MDEIEKTTRRMSSFESLNELFRWLVHHRCDNQIDMVESRWELYICKLVPNYRIMVTQHLGRRYAVFQEQSE